MKIAMIIVRTLLGAMFLFASIIYFLHVKQPAPTGNMKLFTDGLTAVVYLMPLVKATELVCGLALVIGRFVPLATVVIFPITLNILLVNAYLSPGNIGIGVALLIANLFVAYYYRENYKGLFAAK